MFIPLFLSMGCKKFLQVEQLGKTSMPIFYSDMDGVRAGMIGAYSKMYTYYASHFYSYPEIAGDMLTLDLNVASESQKNVYNFMANPDDEVGAVGKIWSDIYVALSNINNLLFYLPDLNTKFPQNKRELQSFQAEALFLRALSHFDLCRVYAQSYSYSPNGSHLGVPILKRTPGPDDKVGRQPLNEVYDFIISDLKEAEKLFEGTEVKTQFYANRLAVQALLSRVYLYKGDWEKCIQYSTLVIDQKPLAQGNDYTQMFNNISIAGSETLFRLNGMDKSASLLAFYNMNPILKDGKIISYTRPIGFPSGKYLNLYKDKRDVRFSKLVQIDSSANGIYYATSKFNVPQSSSSAEKQYYNPFVLRVSEMYLNRAEAYNQVNETKKAANDIKPLIARAYQINLSDVVVDESNKSSLDQVIYEERAKELAFEGHRLFDITRRKSNVVRDPQTNSSIVTITYPNDRFVLPISQKELDANRNMTGNPTVNR